MKIKLERKKKIKNNFKIESSQMKRTIKRYRSLKM